MVDLPTLFKTLYFGGLPCVKRDRSDILISLYNYKGKNLA
jgi:hypothetical protein